METRAARKQRLLQEGRWQQFVARRVAYQADGHDPKTATRLAAAEFEPLGTGGGGNGQSQAADCAGVSERAGPDGLVARDQFQSNHAGTSVVVQWVADNLAVADLRPEDCPSPAAWRLLRWSQSNRLNETEFWRSIWSKTLPSRAQIESLERFADDGRDLIELVDRVERIRRDAERLEGPALPSGPEELAR